MDKSNIVIASDHISQSGQALLYPLNLDAGGSNVCQTRTFVLFTRLQILCQSYPSPSVLIFSLNMYSHSHSPVWQRIPYLLEFLVCCATGHKKSVSVPHSHPTNDPSLKVAVTSQCIQRKTCSQPQRSSTLESHRPTRLQKC